LSRALLTRVDKHLRLRSQASATTEPIATPGELLTRTLTATGAAPDPWQLDALDSEARRLVVVAARQSGKGSVAAAKALHLAVAQPGCLSLIVSASERQAKIVLDRMRSFLPWIGQDAAGAEDTQRDIRLRNGSQIVVLPSSSSSLRGWTVSGMLLCDEAAYLPDASWQAIVPTVAATGAPIWCLTSAGAPTGWLYEIYSQVERFPDWERHTIRADQIARYDREHLEAERRRLPKATYMREYESQFSGSEMGVFQPLLIERAFAAGRDRARERARNPFDLTAVIEKMRA
jgi:hypothetical protein